MIKKTKMPDHMMDHEILNLIVNQRANLIANLRENQIVMKRVMMKNGRNKRRKSLGQHRIKVKYLQITLSQTNHNKEAKELIKLQIMTIKCHGGGPLTKFNLPHN